MDLVEELIGNNLNKDKQKKNYTKANDWKAEQNKLRQWCYENMEEMSQAVRDDDYLFLNYLDVQSKFEKHSVGNCFLILKQNPKVSMFKDKKGWKEAGISLVANPNHFVILEPTNSNGKVFYNPKDVYDISQTNAKPQKEREYDIRVLLKGLINNCYAEIRAVDEMPNNHNGNALYDKDNNIIYVRKGLEQKDLIQSLSYALAEVEFRNLIDSSYKDFKCNCVSYMISKKYGIDVSNVYIAVPPEISTLEKGKDVRKEIEDIRIGFETINNRIVEGISPKTNEEKSKQVKIKER